MHTMSVSFETELLAALPKLRATALMFTRDRAAADDLVQDCVLRALTSQDSYTLGTNLSAWLYRIMRNRFISGLRGTRMVACSIDDVESAALSVGGNQESNIAKLELMKELEALPLIQREAVLLVGAAGLSYEEAAASLDCNVGTVKSRVSRARNTLRLRLNGPDDDDTTTHQIPKTAIDNQQENSIVNRTYKAQSSAQTQNPQIRA
jgi:RNA polymerase sigma-70 factor, ECF subfamily